MEAADGGGGGSEDDVDEFVAILQLMRFGYIRSLPPMLADCLKMIIGAAEYLSNALVVVVEELKCE